MLSDLPRDERLKNLSMLPTNGTKFYRYCGTELYSEDFSADEKAKIMSALNSALHSFGFKAEKHWGELIEDRGSQITFSALGQGAPLDEKKKWDPDFAKRKNIKAILEKLIPEFSIELGGATSIDVTKPGIDKAYGVNKLREMLGVAIQDMLFIGDAVFSRRERLSSEASGRNVHQSA